MEPAGLIWLRFDSLCRAHFFAIADAGIRNISNLAVALQVRIIAR